MGAFDSPTDLANQIKIEGETITVSFSPGKPQSGHGTVEWSIPAPALGCSSDSDGAYCGMVILLSQKPLQITDAPVNGTYYVGDPTADSDLHAGDKINDALVIGAFYEGEKKSRGEELTTSFVIQGLKQNTPYYVVGYASDCQGRYHREGKRAYSAEFGNAVEPGTPGSQVVVLNDDEGVLPTDGTGLVPGMPYEFEFVLNNDFPSVDGNQVIKVSGNGEDFGTYQDLLDAINNTIAQHDNPDQSPVPPNSGRYYWDGKNVNQWDGNNNVPQTALIEPEDPADVAFGDYWYNPDDNTLQRYNIPNPVGWNANSIIEYHKDPTTLEGGGDYWYDGTKAYSWCSTTWCEEPVTRTNTDPGSPQTPKCSSYWYDETESILRNWNIDFERWDDVYAISWEVNPNALTNGTYWYNDTLLELKEYDGVDFNIVTFIDDVEEPTNPNDGDLWYNPESEVLQQWSDIDVDWLDIPVLIWPDDPRDRESCQLWWNTVDDTLHLWDSINNEWDQVSEFVLSPLDPYLTPTVEYGELWFNPDDNTMQRWDGIRWLPVTYINYPTQPDMPPLGTAWHDTKNNKWYVWDTPNTGWNEINPIDSKTDPLIVTSGTLWFDEDDNVLYERMGSTWIAIPFSTTSFYPNHGDKWFDTTNNKLMQWERDPADPLSGKGSWIEAILPAVAELNENGHLVISTTSTGSENMVMILVPEGVPFGQHHHIALGTAGVEASHCGHHGEFANVQSMQTSVSPEMFLFQNLVEPGKVFPHNYGNDALHELPSYEQIGVGTDGSPDERREIIDWVRSQLGAPTVEVELTNKQIDESVDFAIETLRHRTSLAYERGAFFLDVQPGVQHYKLTDRRCGFHKVIAVTSAHRFTSAFLSSAHGSGVYGQIVLQHLYNMGTFDLLSYHLVSQYVEQLEHLFATRLTFHWNEGDRVLSFYQSFAVPERILLDVMLERTEQSIMKDRQARTWIKRFALMRGMETLANIRGKFATLPGAGGGVSLNAADLMTQASQLKEELFMEIEDFYTDDPEGLGMHGTMILG